VTSSTAARDNRDGRDNGDGQGGPELTGPGSEADGRLLRASGIMALGTLASRGTGMLRTIVIAAALGAGPLADAYNIPNAAPNAVYDLLLGGILGSVVVPLLVKAAKDDAAAGEAYAQRLLTVVAVVLGACTVLVVLAAPLVVDVYGGFSGSQRALAITFARYFLPQIFFYGMSATIGAILNTRNRFAAPMWTPVINNVVMITTGALFIAVTAHRHENTLTAGQTTLLGVGTTAGVVLQTLALWPALRASGFRFRPRFDWRGTGLGAAGRLGGWVLAYVVTNQIGFAIVTQLGRAAGAAAHAHGVRHGDTFSAYSYAYQLFQLPYAIIAVSVITALLPRMSAHAAEGRLSGVRADLSTGLRTSAVAVVPATIALAALAPQISVVVFRHYSETAADARYIAWIMVAFAVGLVPFCVFQLMLRAYYALHDTRTPAVVNAVATTVNIVGDVALYLALPPGWRAVGLALGFSASYWVAAFLTARSLSRRIGGVDGRRVVQTYVRLTVAAVVAGAAAATAAQVCVVVLGHAFSGALVALVAGAALGGALLVGLIRRMRIAEATALLAAVRGRAVR
jgi:putative peptidoglycan lipid II flippase